MQVVNIGIIIRNDHGHTFPVALTPQMVSVIQNLLTQIPVLNSKIVDPAGKKIAANASIPIIPRNVEFDWAEAYKPMLPEEEQILMKKLNDQYKMDEAEKQANTPTTDEAKVGGIIVPEGMGKNEDDPEGKVTKLEKPAMFTDKDNPFNLTLDASGTANVKTDLDDEKVMSLAKTASEELDKQTGSDEVETMEDGIEKAAEGEQKEDVATDEIHAERQEIARDELAEDEMADLAETAGAELDKQAGSEDVGETKPQLTKEHIVGEEPIIKVAGKVGDCTVTPVNLKIKGEGNLPG